MYKSFFKAIIDFILAFIGLAVSLPLTLPVTIILFVSQKGNPLFIQARPGKNGYLFNLIKFKTMNDKRDASGNLLPDKDRLTPAGRFIRSTSLDELPQLINVLKGDMSMVGSRPLLVKHLPLYTPEQARRHHQR